MEPQFARLAAALAAYRSEDSATLGPMGGPTWLPRVIGGFVLAASFAALAIVEVLDDPRPNAAPLALTVADAAARVEEGETLHHVHLTDLHLDCDVSWSVGRRTYAGAFGAPRSGPMVLLELSDSHCSSGPLNLVGELDRPPLALLVELDLTDDPHASLLRPRVHDHSGALVYAALALLGCVLAGSGLLRRSRERERLADAHAPPAEPTAEQPGSPFRRAADSRWLLSGPLRISEAWARAQQRRSKLLITLAALLLTAVGLWIASFTREALRDHAVWSHGVAATDVQVHGESRTRALVFNHADLHVTYTDSVGRRHRGRVSRIGIGKLDRGTLPVIRHAADEPERFALSWLIDGFLGQLALHLALSATLAALAGAMLAGARRDRRELTRLRVLLHDDPEEVALEVVRATHNIVHNNHVTTTYRLHIPAGEDLDLTLPRDEFPLFLDLDRSRVLGLRRPGATSHAVVLREDLTPLAAPPREAERVRQRWREGNRQPGKPILDEFIQARFSPARRTRQHHD